MTQPLDTFLSRATSPRPVLEYGVALVVEFTAGVSNTLSNRGNTILNASHEVGVTYAAGDYVAYLQFRGGALILFKVTNPGS